MVWLLFYQGLSDFDHGMLTSVQVDQSEGQPAIQRCVLCKLGVATIPNY